MNKKIIEQLVELEIYKESFLSKEKYEELSSKADDSKICITGNYYDDVNNGTWYKIVDTNGFTTEDIKLMLEIDRTKNIRSIKSMVKFFVVLIVISMIIMFFGGMSLMDALEGIR